MGKISIQDLLDAGVHFGHQTKRWNPKMKHFVYGAKNGISIIDLTKTIHQISDACNFVQGVVAKGGQVLFVGTKRQAQQLIKETAERLGMYYVTERWLGGTLTNNVTIRKSISKMLEYDQVIAAPESTNMKKKEVSLLSRKAEKLHADLDGIKDMRKLPDVIFIVDVCHDNIAVREALKLNIPIIAIVDTNGDPEPIDYPVAANDDAVRSIKIIVDTLADAIGVAAEIYQKKAAEDKIKADAEKAQRDAEAKERREKKAKERPAQKAPGRAPEAAPRPVEKKKVVKKAEVAPVAVEVPAVEAPAEESAEAKEKKTKAAAAKKATEKTAAAPKKKKESEAKAE